MPYPITSIPRKRADVVCWPAGPEGAFLARNRHTGEAFQLGRHEHFLLSQLDGHQSAEQVCAAFSRQFGEPLSGDDLQEFLWLADEQGLLESSARAAAPPTAAEGAGHRRVNPSALRQASIGAKTATRLLAAGAGALQGIASGLNRAAAMLHMFRLMRLDFAPRPDDVFIVTYPRSGTTWMQMILYQLTTDGSMDIPHIAEYCPWFERSLRSGRGFETRPSPRIFKSHLPYGQIPKGPCKYIYVARDGRDVAVSNYHLCRMYTGFEGTFAKYFDRFLRGKVECGTWFRHVQGWWRHRHDENVLFLTYEELAGDLEGTIRRIADFCGIAVQPERLPQIVERCGFAYMKQHEDKFDPAMELLWEQGVELHGFIRAGKVGDGAIRLTNDQQARFEAALRREWEPFGMNWPLPATFST